MTFLDYITLTTDTGFHMSQNLKLVVKLMKAKATFITSYRRMLYKVMALQFMSCKELFWTFTAHIVSCTTMNSHVTIQMLSKQKLLRTQITWKPTAFAVFLNKMLLVLLVGLKLMRAVLAGELSSTCMCHSVLFQLWLRFKLFSTVWTAVRFNVTVNQLMHPHTAIAVEFLFAHRTFKWKIIRVFSVVFIHVFLRSKTSTTFITFKRLCCCMELIVFVPGTRLSKSTTAQRTFIQFLMSMNSQMPRQISCINKTFATKGALVTFLASVSSNVDCQLTSVRKSFITICARVFVIFCMNFCMLLQIMRCCKQLMTILTFMKFFSSMLHNMHFQNVSSTK